MKRAAFVVLAAVLLAACGQEKRTTTSGPLLGLIIVPVGPRIARELRLPARHGLLVFCVRRGSGADAAGIRAGHMQLVGRSYLPVGSDFIVAVNGNHVGTERQLDAALAHVRAGESVRIALYRNSTKRYGYGRRVVVPVVARRLTRLTSCNHGPRIPGTFP